MAYIRVLDYIDIGTGGYLDAVSYQIAKDKDFTKIIDESLHDTIHTDVWHSMLPKLPEDKKPGTSDYYADEDELWARVKVHIGKHESPWVVLKPGNQNKQNVIITEEGKEDIHTTSDAIGMQ